MECAWAEQLCKLRQEHGGDIWKPCNVIIVKNGKSTLTPDEFLIWAKTLGVYKHTWVDDERSVPYDNIAYNLFKQRVFLSY